MKIMRKVIPSNSKTNQTFRFKKVFVIFSLFTSSCALLAAVPTDYNINAAENIDLRVATKHDPNINKKVYSLQDHTNGIYLRNNDCWAADLDLTCASPWNSRGTGQQAGTLITPRHAILAAHYNLKAGDSIRFVTKDNQTVRRKIISHLVNTTWETYTPDIEIVALDSDVPSGITICQLLPANFSTYIANDGLRLPALWLDQEEKALIGDFQYISYGNSYKVISPVIANRLAMSESVVSGDSGNPVFLVLNGKMVLVGVITGSGPSGHSLFYYANLPTGGSQPNQSLDDLIKAVDAKVGIDTGYKISFFDFTLTGVNDIEAAIVDQVFAHGRTLFIKPGTTKDTQVQVFDLFGKQIIKKDICNQTLNCDLPTNGVFIVTLTNVNAKQSYKVFVQ